MRRALLALALSLACGAVLAQPRGKPVPWGSLTAEQQTVLAPLKGDWEKLDAERRQKWLGIAKRYPKMKPEAQARVQRRMQAWAMLTPEQRRQARENYKELAKTAPKEKRPNLREQWAEYQRQLPATPAVVAPPVVQEAEAEAAAEPPAATAEESAAQPENSDSVPSSPPQ